MPFRRVGESEADLSTLVGKLPQSLPQSTDNHCLPTSADDRDTHSGASFDRLSVVEVKLK